MCYRWAVRLQKESSLCSRERILLQTRKGLEEGPRLYAALRIKYLRERANLKNRMRFKIMLLQPNPPLLIIKQYSKSDWMTVCEATDHVVLVY